ncbi:helix-turn-helix domain-containing protein [Legionella feeleii]
MFEEKAKLTQKSLADFCNLSHNGISRIELAQSDAPTINNFKNV